MSSTWTRSELALRGALHTALAKAGSTWASPALMGLAAALQVAAIAWGALGATVREVVLLRASWAFGLVALAVSLDAVLSAWRRLEDVVQAWPRRSGWAAEDRRALLAGGLITAAHALAAAALVASWLSHDVTGIRLAEGERYGQPDQVVSFEGTPGAVVNPPRVDLGVIEVDAVGGRDGRLSATSATLAVSEGAQVQVRRWRPLWLAATLLVVPGEAGVAPRFELRDGNGGLLEDAFSKVEVYPRGKRDVITFERTPHRVFLWLPPPGAGDGAWSVHAYRAKLPLASKTLARGEALEFDGLRFAVVGSVSTVTLLFVRDAGLPLAAAAAVAGIMAWVASGAWLRAPRRGGGDDDDG